MAASTQPLPQLLKEWYGWHFPELSAILPDPVKYAQFVVKVGPRENARHADLGTFLDVKEQAAVETAAMTSLGSDISDEDFVSITALARQLLERLQQSDAMSD
jgi:RNA processing factor Prp31